MSRRIRAAGTGARRCARFPAGNRRRLRGASGDMVNKSPTSRKRREKWGPKFARARDRTRSSLAELLDFAEALPTGLVDRAVMMAAHAETVAVGILHIHFANAP